MKNPFALYVDLDHTSAIPRWFHEDLVPCAQSSQEAGLVTAEQVANLTSHQRLFLLPQVLRTHLHMPGAVETLERLARADDRIHSLTFRNHIEPAQCQQVHDGTRAWLREQGFPFSEQVCFFWDAPDKLCAALDADAPRSLLIDDRPADLLDGSTRLSQSDPAQAAQARERVLLAAFHTSTWNGHLAPLADLPRVVPLPDWATCELLLFQLERESRSHVVSSVVPFHPQGGMIMTVVSLVPPAEPAAAERRAKALALGPWRYQVGQSFSEDPTRAGDHITKEFADAQDQLNVLSRTGQVFHDPTIAAMQASGWLLTERTQCAA